MGSSKVKIKMTTGPMEGETRVVDKKAAKNVETESDIPKRKAEGARHLFGNTL